MIELLRRGAQADPARPAVVTHDEVVTYGELLARAEATAAGLQERGISRVGTLEGSAATVVAVLAGASVAGVEVCQYPPAEPEGAGELAERFDHELVLTTDPAVRPGSAVLLDPAALAESGTPEAAAPLPAARPHLVLTTGTTGAPKGVRHDWTRLVRSVSRVQPAPDQRWLLAYGLHQFAGLQVLLHVLASGATLVAPVPRRPREGLRAMRELDVTHASATPTYWRFLLNELRADGGPTPRLRQITLGGEAIPGPLLPQLTETFPDASVSQVYAASEFGSSGSVKDRRPGLSTSVLDRGEDADVAMKVVDGELWVRSRTGMLGYYGEPPVEDPDGWRPTGDLVEVVDDRLEFRGRSSEVINVGGVKVHPLPVEELISRVPGVALARVWGRPNAMTGSIVAADVVLTPEADRTAVRDAVRAACEHLVPASRPRSVRFVDEIETRGDKIVRKDNNSDNNQEGS